MSTQAPRSSDRARITGNGKTGHLIGHSLKPYRVRGPCNMGAHSPKGKFGGALGRARTNTNDKEVAKAGLCPRVRTLHDINSVVLQVCKFGNLFTSNFVISRQVKVGFVKQEKESARIC